LTKEIDIFNQELAGNGEYFFIKESPETILALVKVFAED
jgi:hypothetical protein